MYFSIAVVLFLVLSVFIYVVRSFFGLCGIVRIAPWFVVFFPSLPRLLVVYVCLSFLPFFLSFLLSFSLSVF